MVFPQKYKEKSKPRSIRLPDFIKDQIIANYGTLQNWVDKKLEEDKKLDCKRIDKKGKE